MRLKNIGIKWKLFGYFLCFSLIMLALLWVFQIVFLNDFYKAIKISELKNYSNYISKNIDSISFNSDFYRKSSPGDISISVFSNDGTLIFTSDIMRNNILHKIPSQALFNIAKDFSSKGIEYIEQIPDFESPNRKSNPMIDNILYIKNLTNSNNETYLIVLNSTIIPVSATVNTLRAQLIFVTIIMLLLSLILSFSISKKISKPIININNEAKTLATGDYTVSFSEDGYKEISELAGTLNYTANELSKVEELRRELIANISHDLRTPLTMITGYAEVIRDLPNENTPKNVQIIIDEATRLTSLVNDILDISKIQSGVQALTLNKFDITKLLEEIALRYQKLTSKDGYEIILNKTSSCIINGDELKITQVIYNLINNAITYTGANKKIIINEIIKDDIIRIEIIDTGDGISSENLPYIWDRYYKIHDTHKRAYIGTGLGLSIVCGILKLHNANFGVESEIEHGSNFWFELKFLKQEGK